MIMIRSSPISLSILSLLCLTFGILWCHGKTVKSPKKSITQPINSSEESEERSFLDFEGRAAKKTSSKKSLVTQSPKKTTKPTVKPSKRKHDKKHHVKPSKPKDKKHVKPKVKPTKGSQKIKQERFGENGLIQPGSPYVPGKTQIISQNQGQGSIDDPCQEVQTIIEPQYEETLGSQAAKGFHKGSNIPLSAVGHLGNALAGKQGAITKDPAYTDKLFTGAQDVVSTAGGTILDAAGKITGLGKPLKQIGAGNMFGSFAGLVGGGLATLIKAPQDAAKVIASAGGIGKLVGMGKPGKNQPPKQILIPNNKNPCGPGSVVQVGPNRVTAG